MSFPAIEIGSGVLGFRPYWCPSPFPSLSILGVFHSLFLPLDFNRVSSLRPTYRHPFGRPFPYSLFRRVSRLGTGFGTLCCGPRGGQRCAWSRKLDPNFCSGRGRTSELGIRLPRTPPFSRLLRHPEGYSKTILTPNLQGFHFIPITYCLFASWHTYS